VKRLLSVSILALFFLGIFHTSALAETYSGGHDTSGASSPSTTWYFAEGYTGEGFNEWLCLQNPNFAAANVTVTCMFREGGMRTYDMAIAANARETVSVNSLVGPGKEVSLKVESDQAVVAERPMYFNYKNKWKGGHDTIGATSPSTTWYFAEGYTGSGFEEWLTLQNPNETDATATITYMYRGGGTRTTTKTIPANSRETIEVNGDAGANKEVATKVESSRPIVAERPVYFDYQSTSSQNRCRGGHNTVGATSPSTTSYFAEGYTGSGFEEWLTLQNPNETDATATITYMYRGGGTKTTTKAVPANSRETVYVNHETGTNKEVSVKVESSQPLVTERPVYFAIDESCDGGHNTLGVTSANNQWYFAEGYTGEGFKEWLALQNPNGTDATVTITYMYRGGGTKTTTRVIPANSRETIDVNADAGTNKEMAIMVASTQPIVAERPEYFSYQPISEHGNPIATEQPSKQPQPAEQPATPPAPADKDWSLVDLRTLLPRGDIPGYARVAVIASGDTASLDLIPMPATQITVRSLLFSVRRMDSTDGANNFIKNTSKKVFPNNPRDILVRGHVAYFGTNIYGYANLSWAEEVLVYEIQMLSTKGTPADLYDDIVEMPNYLP